VVVFSKEVDAGFDDDPVIIANLDIDDDVGDDRSRRGSDSTSYCIKFT
jgi:hypothetical protein